jgi:hypothetical protein
MRIFSGTKLEHTVKPMVQSKFYYAVIWKCGLHFAKIINKIKKQNLNGWQRERKTFFHEAEFV